MKVKPTPRCRNNRRYKGKRVPRCNGGYGCYGCWKRYYYEQDEDVR